MLDQLLELVTFEKLLFFFKEQSLSVLENKNATSSLSKENYVKITDSDLLRKILPQEISKQMFGNSNLTLLAFVFALRHKITLLNLLFHVSSLSQQQDRENFLENLDKILKLKLSQEYYEYENLLQPDFWGSSFYLPVIGFSAVGCLFSMQAIKHCRAFDHYDIIFCANQSEFIFCSNHKAELFWENEFANEASTQAKMFRFYLDKNNFNEFDEATLQKLLNNFFYKYSSYKNTHFKKEKQESFSEKIKILLSFYNFSTIEELKKSGIEGLRKRFLQKAKQCHPDVGGSQDLFREARNVYEQLRELI